MITRLSPVRRRTDVRRLAVIAGLTIAIASCGGDEGKVTSDTSKSGGGLTTRTKVDDEGIGVWHDVEDTNPVPIQSNNPSLLPGSVAVTGYDKDAFYKFTRSRRWYGWMRPRCDGSGGGNGCGGKTRVIVEAIEGANRIDATMTPIYDLVVGRILGIDKKKETRYPQCVSDQNNVEVECYLFVKANSNEEWFAIMTFATGSTSPTSLKVEQVMAAPNTPRRFTKCEKHGQYAQGHGDFKTCPPGKDGRPAPHVGDENFWMTCNEGCCS